jgi:hypothetical protein
MGRGVPGVGSSGCLDGERGVVRVREWCTVQSSASVLGRPKAVLRVASMI